MSKQQGKKGPRRVEVTGPEDGHENSAEEAKRPAAESQEETLAEEAEEQAGVQEKDETTEEELEKLQTMLAELEQKCAYAEDQHLRVVAELQNYKRRVQQEKEQLVRFATEGLISELIPILDNFERALQAEIESPDAQSLMAGVKMIYNQLLTVLETQGVEPIEALGETFDPNIHEAVEREETTALPPNVVVAELAKGYRMHGRVIRPSKVRVTVKPEQETDQSDDASAT